MTTPSGGTAPNAASLTTDQLAAASALFQHLTASDVLKYAEAISILKRLNGGFGVVGHRLSKGVAKAVRIDGAEMR